MTSTTVPVVVVTGHARTRATERLPGIPANQVDRLIRADVRAALAAGRVAKRKPGFLHADGAQVKSRGEAPRRICWTACETRAYVLKRQRTERGPAVVVLTVLRAAAKRAA